MNILTYIQNSHILLMQNLHSESAKDNRMRGRSENLLAGGETWKAILEPALCKDSAAVECLARLLFLIKKEINGGPEGVIRASKILSDGIEALYLYTSAHKVALKLYVLSLGGNLKPQDEPLNLLKTAIQRGKLKAR